MERSCSPYVNERPSCSFHLSSFFSFTGFFKLWTSSHIYIYIYIYFFSCREQQWLFKLPKMAVILTHNCRFIYFILFSMADPSPPFMPALMTQAFKKRVSLQSKHKLLIFQNILSVSLPPSFSSFRTPIPILLWSNSHAIAPVKSSSSSRRKRKEVIYDVTHTVSAPLWLTLRMMSILLSPRFLVTMCHRR